MIFRILLTIFLWWLVLILASAAAMTSTTFLLCGAWLSGLVTQSGMLVFSVALVALIGKGRFRPYGFQKPTRRFLWPALVAGLAIGAVMAGVEGFVGTSENPIAKDLSFLQIVFLIWVWASLCEEVLYRGLLQTFLVPLAGHGFSIFGFRVSLPVVIAAILFSLSHLALITVGMAIASVIPIVIFTLLLGTVAGYWRDQTGSLIPAIVVHAAGNIAGTLIGYLIA